MNQFFQQLKKIYEVKGECSDLVPCLSIHNFVQHLTFGYQNFLSITDIIILLNREKVLILHCLIKETLVLQKFDNLFIYNTLN